MLNQSITHTWKRFRTLRTHRITALPIVILMPHSACNCRCVMCDIWKGNRDLKQLTKEDIAGLLSSLGKFGTRQVVMSGGEALLNPNFFNFYFFFFQNNLNILFITADSSSHHFTVKKSSPAITLSSLIPCSIILNLPVISPV